MGWVGSYTAHVYCDACNDMIEVPQLETAAEIRHCLRDYGYLFRQDGTIICNMCATREDLKVLPEYEREGGSWKHRWPKYVPKPTPPHKQILREARAARSTLRVTGIKPSANAVGALGVRAAEFLDDLERGQ